MYHYAFTPLYSHYYTIFMTRAKLVKSPLTFPSPPPPRPQRSLCGTYAVSRSVLRLSWCNAKRPIIRLALHLPQGSGLSGIPLTPQAHYSRRCKNKQTHSTSRTFSMCFETPQNIFFMAARSIAPYEARRLGGLLFGLLARWLARCLAYFGSKQRKRK